MRIFPKRQNKNRQSRHMQVDSGRKVSVNSYYRSQGSREREHSSMSSRSAQQKDTGKSIFQHRFKVSRIVNAFIFVGIVGLGLYATTLTTSPTVQITEDSFRYRSSQEYQEFAMELMDDSITRRSKLLFRSRSFENEMIRRYPEIERVNAVLPIAGRDLAVIIKTSTPLVRAYSGTSRGILDSNGVLATNSLTSPSTQELLTLRFTVPQEGFQKGARILTSSEVELLRTLQSELDSLQLSDSGVESPQLQELLFNVRDGQVEVRFRDLDFYVKISVYEDSREQVGALIATLRYLDKNNALPEKYVDVRVSGRAFVL